MQDSRASCSSEEWSIRIYPLGPGQWPFIVWDNSRSITNTLNNYSDEAPHAGPVLPHASLQYPRMRLCGCSTNVHSPRLVSKLSIMPLPTTYVHTTLSPALHLTAHPFTVCCARGRATGGGANFSPLQGRACPRDSAFPLRRCVSLPTMVQRSSMYLT